MDHDVVKKKKKKSIGAEGPKVHIHAVSFTTSVITGKLILFLNLGFF